MQHICVYVWPILDRCQLGPGPRFEFPRHVVPDDALAVSILVELILISLAMQFRVVAQRRRCIDAFAAVHTS